MNSAPSMQHLTDEQLDDVLIGDFAGECATHLAGCDECRMRLAEAGAPIASFNAVSLAWSERRSATLPTPTHTSGSAWLPRAIWGATAAAVLAVGVSVPAVRHVVEGRTAAAHQSSPAPTLMASTGPVDNPVVARDEQIARDNRMLENIDRELDASAPSPDQEYGLHASRTAPSTSAPIRN